MGSVDSHSDLSPLLRTQQIPASPQSLNHRQRAHIPRAHGTPPCGFPVRLNCLSVSVDTTSVSTGSPLSSNSSSIHTNSSLSPAGNTGCPAANTGSLAANTGSLTANTGSLAANTGNLTANTGSPAAKAISEPTCVFTSRTTKVRTGNLPRIPPVQTATGSDSPRMPTSAKSKVSASPAPITTSASSNSSSRPISSPPPSTGTTRAALTKSVQGMQLSSPVGTSVNNNVIAATAGKPQIQAAPPAKAVAAKSPTPTASVAPQKKASNPNVEKLQPKAEKALSSSKKDLRNSKGEISSEDGPASRGRSYVPAYIRPIGNNNGERKDGRADDEEYDKDYTIPPSTLKMIESIIKRMQEGPDRVPIRDIRNFMSKVPSVFTGADLILWIMKHLDCEDQVEALHLAHMICAHGYIFPIDDHALTVKNDGTYFRFQTPCLWLSRCQEPENQDYAVYLCKRTMQSKQRLELANYEAEHLARLQKAFARKWDLIYTQAETEIRTERKCDRKLGEGKYKMERKVLDSQERAFWDVHRPAPGCINTTEVDIKKACKSTQMSPPALPSTAEGAVCRVERVDRCPSFNGTRASDVEQLLAQKEYLLRQLNRRRQKVSKVGESLGAYTDLYAPYDPLINLGLPQTTANTGGATSGSVTSSPTISASTGGTAGRVGGAAGGGGAAAAISWAQPSPWLSENADLWDAETSLTNVHVGRHRRWAYGIGELLKDPAGKELFVVFLKQSFCNENIRFWDACQELKGAPVSQVPRLVQEIYSQYLEEGAADQVNVDCKVAEHTKLKVSQPNPGRYCFEMAEDHIFNLMKNDSYTRFIRSDLYLEDQRVMKKKVSVASKVNIFTNKASTASFGSVKA